MSHKKIIVSADDFGISCLATKNILKLSSKNRLDRVEVMISDNIKKEEIEQLLASGVGIDVHLHLVKDKLDYWQNNKRVIEKGAIKRIFLFLYGYFFGNNQPKMVELEWDGQIKKFIKLFGQIPDGISSHEHIHFFPPYFKVILKLSMKYKIPYVRFGSLPVSENNTICRIMNLLRKINRRAFKKSGLLSSDCMISFDWIKNPKHFINTIPENTKAEIVFHPELNNEYDFLENFPK